jgi:signal peptidase I
MGVADATNVVAGGRPPGRARALAHPTATFVHWFCIATAVVILGGISLLSLLGYRLMVVTGPSMTPRFGPGDAVVIRPTGATGIEVGDVITYRTPGTDGMTTHRVVDIRRSEGTTWFETKGDANAAPDPLLTSADNVYGRELVTLRGMGRPLLFAVSPWGKLAILGFPVSYLIAHEAGVVMAVRRRRYGASVERPPEEAVEQLAQLASGLEGRVGRDSAEVAELLDRLERTEAELRAQAFRLAALESALAESDEGREPGKVPSGAGSVLTLP